MSEKRDEFSIIEKELVPQILKLIEGFDIKASTAPYVADYLKSMVALNNEKAFEEYPFKVRQIE